MKKGELNNILKIFYDVIIKNKNFQFEDEFGPYKKFEKFPYDLCDITSELLKRFLFEEFSLDFSFIGVNYNTPHRHVFLENKDYVIDITASQFNEFPDFQGVENFPKVAIIDRKEKYYFSSFIEEDYFTYIPKWDDDVSYNKFYIKLKEDFYNT